jgi:hypothetical protein
MPFFTHIAQAAENTVVSCTGSDCSLCSLLETVSRGYNFFLAVSCAVAVLVLIVAGVNYLLNGGDWGRIQKSKYFFKSVLIGFAVVLAGWLVVQTVIKTIGYQNAGGWWEFQCGTEAGQSAKEQASGSQNPAYYDSLKTFPDLTAFMKSGERAAKLTGPIDALAFASQVNSLKDGEVLHFLAPVKVDSTNGSENLYLPLLSVVKNGGQVKLRSTGEYWNLVQNSWPKTAKVADNKVDGKTAALLDKLLGTNSFTDDRSLITSGGNALGGTDLTGLYGSIADLLKGSGDRTENQTVTDLSQASLSDLIAMAGSYSPGENPTVTDKLISTLTTQVLKMVSGVVVEKEDTGTAVAGSVIAGWRCESSGGTWKENKCACPDQQVLGTDLRCHDAAALKAECEKSGGAWQTGSDEVKQTLACGSAKNISDTLPVPEWQQNAERAGESDVVSGSGFCACPGDSCLSGEGICLAGGGDQDGDKVTNNVDACPSTPDVDKDAVNRDKKSQFYGCSCSEIGTLAQACPPDQCVGDNWADYPDSAQSCKNGQLGAYSCQPVSRSYDERCVDQGGGGTGTTNSNNNTNSSQWAQTNTNSFQNTFNPNQNKSATAPKSNPNSPSASKSPNKANGGNKKIGDSASPTNPGEGMTPSTNDHGNPEGVKGALKRIYQRDKLRYLMVFKYLTYIEPVHSMAGAAGVTVSSSSGVIEVNFRQAVKELDQTIIHELHHRADFAYYGWSSSSFDMEHIAVAGEAGSVGRVKESPGQKEEVKVTLNEGKGEEVRGYECRWLDRDIDPQGDMNPSDVAFAVSYARGMGRGGVKSSNIVYGWPPGKEWSMLNVSDYQEGRIKLIMDGVNKRTCMSRPSDDLPQLSTENGYTEDQLNGCKKEDTKTHLLKIYGEKASPNPQDPKDPKS